MYTIFFFFHKSISGSRACRNADIDPNRSQINDDPLHHYLTQLPHYLGLGVNVWLLVIPSSVRQFNYWGQIVAVCSQLGLDHSQSLHDNALYRWSENTLLPFMGLCHVLASFTPFREMTGRLSAAAVYSLPRCPFMCFCVLKARFGMAALHLLLHSMSAAGRCATSTCPLIQRRTCSNLCACLLVALVVAH